MNTRTTSDRGQTPQDFALGITILLVTIIATFGFVQGSLVTAYDQPVTGDIEESADRVSMYLVENFSVSDRENVLRFNQSNGINETLNRDTPELARLKEAAGLDVATDRRTAPELNVTIVGSASLRNGTQKPAKGANGQPLSWGPAFSDQPDAASTTRVITLENSGNTCSSVCWLVVRVW